MRKSIFILLLIFAFNLQAQDIHFSQFTISKIGLNPALVGSQQGDYKTRFQKSKSSYYRKRVTEDSKININKSLKSQFNLMRTSDDKNYPSYFCFNKKKYLIKLIKSK